MTIVITLPFSSTEWISPPLDSPPSLQWSVRPELDRNFVQPSERNVRRDVGRHRREQVVADKRQLHERPEARQLPRHRLEHLLVVLAREKSVSAGFSLFLRTRE